MKEGGLYIYEAALLVETGQHNNFDELIVINAPAEIRRDRLIRRDGITPELANQILAAQTSDEARKQAATILIENNGSEEELKQQVHQVAARLRAMK
jgi:dephospho-CoA kinase